MCKINLFDPIRPIIPCNYKRSRWVKAEQVSVQALKESGRVWIFQCKIRLKLGLGLGEDIFRGEPDSGFARFDPLLFLIEKNVLIASKIEMRLVKVLILIIVTNYLLVRITSSNTSIQDQIK